LTISEMLFHRVVKAASTSRYAGWTFITIVPPLVFTPPFDKLCLGLIQTQSFLQNFVFGQGIFPVLFRLTIHQYPFFLFAAFWQRLKRFLW
jgi:hypothetical protein